MTAQNSISKKSYFGSYFRYKLFKNKNLLILSLIFSILGIPTFAACISVCTGILNDFINAGVFNLDNIQETLGTVDTILMSGVIVSVVSVVIFLIMPFVVSNVIFGYNLKKCDADMILPLPLGTTQRFFADLLSGSVICILPTLLTGAVSAVVTSVSKIALSDKITQIYNNGNCTADIDAFYRATNLIVYKDIAGVVLYLLISIVIVQALMYAFCVMINACAGRTADSIIYSVLGMVVLSMAVVSFARIIMGRLTSVSSDEQIFSLAMYAAPLGPIFSFIGSFFNSYKYVEYQMEGTLWQSDMFSVFSVRNITVLAVLFVIYLGLAYLATRLRKAEKTGSPFVFELPYHIITLGLVVTVFANITGTTGLHENNITAYVACLVISIVLYLLAELTHGRKIRKLWQSFVRYGCAVAGSLLLCFVMRSYDIFGLEHYVPSTFFVDNVSVSTSKAFNEFCGGGIVNNGFQEFDDERSIKAITDYHSFIVNNGYARAGGNGVVHYIGTPDDQYTDYTTVSFKYRLKDGSIVTRTFNVNIQKDKSAEYAKKLYDMRCAMSESDGYQSFFEYFGSAGNGWDIIFHRDDGELYGRKLKTELNEKLIKALKNDMKAGRNTGKLAAVLDFVLADATYSSMSVEIRENCKETLAILENKDNSTSRREKIIGALRTAKYEYDNTEAGTESGSDEYNTSVGVETDYNIYKIEKILSPYQVSYSSDWVYAVNAEMAAVPYGLADSEAVTEFEKLCKMYDFYTDGVLSDKKYVMTEPSMNAFGGAIYYIPDENVSRAEKLYKTIIGEYQDSTGQSPDNE